VWRLAIKRLAVKRLAIKRLAVKRGYEKIWLRLKKFLLQKKNLAAKFLIKISSINLLVSE